MEGAFFTDEDPGSFTPDLNTKQSGVFLRTPVTRLGLHVFAFAIRRSYTGSSGKPDGWIKGEARQPSENPTLALQKRLVLCQHS